MLGAGINVCVGTDSLASNPSLSILDELRFLRRAQRDVPADTLLAMGTWHGARALGFDRVVGTLAVGKQADLAIVPLDTNDQAAGWERMLDLTTPPIAVYVSGVLQSKPFEASAS